MSDKEILEELKKLIKQVTNEDYNLSCENMVVSGVSSKSLPLCSLDLVKWLLEIEEKFKIEIDENDRNVGDIVRKIRFQLENS